MRPHKTASRAERGATLTEYALLVGLLVVVCLSAISALQTKSTSTLSARSGRAGNPDSVEAGSPGGGTTGGTTGGTGGTTTGGSPPTAPSGVTVTSISGTKSSDPPNWIATVTVVVRDSGGSLASGVTITGVWNPAVAGSTVSCTTTATGECIFTQKDMKASGGNSIDSVTFTVSDMTFSSSSPPVTYPLSSPAPSTTVTKP